jgi:hypothetical protein
MYLLARVLYNIPVQFKLIIYLKFLIMKIKILLSAMLLLFATFSFAQAQGDMKKMTVSEKVKKTVSELTPVLTLDNDQQTKMEGIYTDFYTAKEKMHESTPAGAQPDPAKKQKLMTDRDQQIQTVLTPDQYTKYKAWETEMMKKKKDKSPQQ